MWDCKVCLEKDRRLEDLKEQISYLRNILNPPKFIQQDIPQNDLQEDMILSGAGKEETELVSNDIETAEILAERSAILSGTY